jgi:hypothetical protein
MEIWTGKHPNVIAMRGEDLAGYLAGVNASAAQRAIEVRHGGLWADPETAGLDHLPSDVADSLAAFDAGVADGDITADAHGHARPRGARALWAARTRDSHGRFAR